MNLNLPRFVVAARGLIGLRFVTACVLACTVVGFLAITGPATAKAPPAQEIPARNVAIQESVSSQQASMPDSKAVDLDRLLQQLDSDQFSERQAAMHRLWQLGPEATAKQLHERQQTGSLESRQRARALLHRFRIGLVPGMDPSLARQIMNFESGNAAQKASCVERLLKSGHVQSAMALVRSVAKDRGMNGMNQLTYDPAHYVRHWLRNGQWQAMEDFFSDASVSDQYMLETAGYYRAMGTIDQKRLELQPAVETESGSAEKKALTVNEILGSPKLSRQQALKLLACFDHWEAKYEDCDARLQQVEDSETMRFLLNFSIGNCAAAAELVTELQSRRNRRFVLPEEDVARQLCQALLLGWAGDRQRMREILLAQKPGPDQVYTHTCALMAAADPQLMQQVVQQLQKTDTTSLFELYGDLERWDLAFDVIQYPVNGDAGVCEAWLEERLKPMRESPLDYRRSNERTALMTLAESLQGLGLEGQAEQIMSGLVQLPSEDEFSKDYSRIQLCRRAVAFGMYDWALQQCFKFKDSIDEDTMVAIWFSDSASARFWYHELLTSDREFQLGLSFGTLESEDDFGRLIALIGRLTRSSDLQTLEPARFMDLEEVKRCADLAFAVYQKDGYNQTAAAEALLRLLWDYQQYDQIVRVATQLDLDSLPDAYQQIVSMAQWQNGDYSGARRKFWQAYWDDSESLESLVLATLPDGFDLFQFLPDLQGQDLDELQLLAEVRPWQLSASQRQQAIQWTKLRATAGNADSIDWSNVSDDEITLTARLHYDLLVTAKEIRLGVGRTFQGYGADRLAAWQTLEYKTRSIWDEVDQNSIGAASSMLGYVEGMGPRGRKQWRAEVIAASLLTYPIGKAGIYGTFGVGLRTAELQMALSSEDVQKAEQIAGEVLQIHPHDIDVVQHLTEYYDRKGRVDEGNRIFDRSFETLSTVQSQYPQSALLANNLAWMCVQGNRKLDQAQQLVTTAMQLEPGTSNYPDTLADVFWKQGKFEEARQMNQRSRNLAPTRSYYRRQTLKFMEEQQSMSPSR